MQAYSQAKKIRYLPYAPAGVENGEMILQSVRNLYRLKNVGRASRSNGI